MAPKKIASSVDLGREVWAIWDATAEVWELFASPEGDDYIGCADTIPEAQQVAREWFNECMSY